MKKRWLSLAVAATAAITVLAGCGSKAAETTAAATEAATTEAASSEAAESSAEETKAEAAETTAAAAEEKKEAADGELITVGYAQVGAESDWRTRTPNPSNPPLPKKTAIS